ncbi:MAG TPA: DUF58 domain-containing protein [Spirochaetota bacterium]|nr:DUF58 domain-containing protein [Spirochaetota bacterium]
MRGDDRSVLRRIKLRTRHKLDTVFVGEYHSAFKGMGLSFNSVREYQYGDDVRNVDWNVSARMNHLFVKEYIEERELSVVLMIDLSASVEFGSARSKRDVVMDIATLFLYLAQMNNDRISVLLFTDRVEKYLVPRKGRKSVLSVLDELVKYRPAGRRTNIGAAIDFLQRVLKKRSVIIMVSDFLDDDYLLKMKLLRRRHDVIPVVISDPMEKELRLFGLAEFVDLETGEAFLSDTVPEKGTLPFLKEFDSINLSTDAPIELPVLHFFEKRNRTILTRQ